MGNEKQAEIEAECQDIDAMACQGGVKALCDEAHFHQDEAFPGAISIVLPILALNYGRFERRIDEPARDA